MRARWRTWCALTVLVAVGACDDATPPLEPNPEPVPRASGDLSWRTLASAPSARTEVAATALDGRIYVAGGYRGDGATVATVEIFDIGGNQWVRGPDLPVPVNHAMAATVGGAVYVFGGYDGRNQAFAGAFRLEKDSWRSIAALPEPRAAGTTAVVGGSVYLAGGIGAGGALAERMLVYDAGGDRWSTEAGPPTPREHLGGAAFGGQVYTVGGRTAARGNLSAFEAFDVGTRKWSSKPAMPTARGGLSAAATCHGRIVAVGGEASATFAEAEAFDVRTGAWQALPKLPTPRHGLGVVSVGTVLYTLSGGPKPGLFVSESLEAIDLGPCP